MLVGLGGRKSRAGGERVFAKGRGKGRDEEEPTWAGGQVSWAELREGSRREAGWTLSVRSPSVSGIWYRTLCWKQF